MSNYPHWRSYPNDKHAERWVLDIVDAFEQLRSTVSTEDGSSPLTRDELLAVMRPRLERLGYRVERGRARDQRVALPVQFGGNGEPVRTVDVDAFREHDRTIFAIEAGRGAQNNEDIKNLVMAALTREATHLVLAMPLAYQFGREDRRQVKRAYEHTRDLLDLIYASSRIDLGLEGVLLIGY
jgi:hypothetical protein